MTRRTLLTSASTATRQSQSMRLTAHILRTARPSIRETKRGANGWTEYSPLSATICQKIENCNRTEIFICKRKWTHAKHSKRAANQWSVTATVETWDVTSFVTSIPTTT